MALRRFHPAVRTWFERHFDHPTPAQTEAWPGIAAGEHTLIAAPTGSGKTLAAFLAAINQLVEESLLAALPDAVQILYVSPLKALSNDIQKNLEGPLAEISEELEHQGQLYGHDGKHTIRCAVRTGDTPASARQRMRRTPPHILVTTPESLYILLTSESGRAMLSSVRTLIVDEIHALAGNKRGSHLSLSLERLAALTHQPLTRVGLSATQKPIAEVARFLVGNRDEPCKIIDSGHRRDRDLALELPSSPLEAIMSTEVWDEVYQRLVELIDAHRTTLIFVNTRRYAERISHHLAERIGEQHIAAHHGSLSREHRLQAEQRLKKGQLKVMVATASLELGIDIGEVDLVCQLGSPKAIAAFLQRVGRSGHAVDGTPKGRLFPLSRDDLVECSALLQATQSGELDRLVIPSAPLDVLAQQIVAETACEEQQEEALYELCRRAHPYRDLPRDRFDAVIKMLAEGFSTRRGRRSAHLHYDGIHQRIRARKGARLTAITNGGAIPDLFDYDVRLEPEGLFVGTLNEDFAFESLPGDIFQLGNTSYRVLRVQMGTVRVEDAHGLPPSIPFWFGEAPGRTDELSVAVSHLRIEAEQILNQSDHHALYQHYCLSFPEAAARQLADYLAAAHAALGCLPSHETLVLERFFDEAGDMHLVVHSPYGSRLNRAWGLSLRKRFCRSFNFELQAAALEDSIVLSLSSTHSFKLEEVASYLNAKGVRDLLIQAMFDSPMFAARWRWNATTALALQRFRSGKRVAPQLQRMSAEDLIAVVFPDQLACLENIAGDRDIPDHPLVQQTIADCLHEAMDIEALEAMLTRLEAGQIRVVACDLPEPSMLAREILTASPYAFLDDAPAEERRTQMVHARRFVDPQSAEDMGQLDPEAIARVRQEAWPEVTCPDELHDALMMMAALSAEEGAAWQVHFDELVATGRARQHHHVWIATERAAHIAPLWDVTPIDAAALLELVRGRLEASGPINVAQLVAILKLPQANIEQALIALETEGFVFRGHYTHPAASEEWCERRLLARIHRYTIKRLRSEIEPVSAADCMRYLLRWQGLDRNTPREGPDSLYKILEQLTGTEAPAIAWETAILPARLTHYDPDWLDQLSREGKISWARLQPGKSSSGPVRNTPLALLPRRQLRLWRKLTEQQEDLSSQQKSLLDLLQDNGASFLEDLQEDSKLLPAQLEEALGQLVSRGLIHSDQFAGLRALITAKPTGRVSRRRRGKPVGHLESRLQHGGRWALLRPPARPEDRAEQVARQLLRRYGIVFRKLLERELDRLPPWRELLYVLRRMEARGEIRGGRFVAGFAGEQYALPEAVKALRKARKDAKEGTLIAISAADPLNQTGILLPGPRVPSQVSNRLLLRDGVVIATLIAGEEHFTDPPDSRELWSLRQTLLGHPQRAAAAIPAISPGRWGK